ncbi:MAG: biotin transporter BioY [Candidatus Edwardsbacteria bacterium]|nr:biotin transporter BioY [Candidatus Edwardsbacteria bacterium]
MERILSRSLTIDRTLSGVLAIILFTALTALGAFVRVPLPFTPVPVTLQVFFVLLSAVVLGRRAAISQALYLSLGAAGLPLFTGASGGFAHLLGPTGGYLLGFVAAAFVVGMATATHKSAGAMSLSLLLGIAIIHGCGTLQLGLLLQLAPPRAVQLGVVPFIAGDLLKAAAALAVAQGIKR